MKLLTVKPVVKAVIVLVGAISGVLLGVVDDNQVVSDEISTIIVGIITALGVFKAHKKGTLESAQDNGGGE